MADGSSVGGTVDVGSRADPSVVAPRVVLVHGATSDPGVFDGWLDRWPGFEVRVPDLQAGLDVAHATMGDYVDRVLDEVGADGAVVCGWSMGGLVAMMAAQRLRLQALVVLEPSVPLEVDGGDPGRALRPGTYEAASAYGPSVPGMRHRPESLLARCERKRGISVPRIECPMLVVGGADYTETRSRPVARLYGAELLERPELGHFELVVDERVCDAVAEWARGKVSGV